MIYKTNSGYGVNFNQLLQTTANSGGANAYGISWSYDSLTGLMTFSGTTTQTGEFYIFPWQARLKNLHKYVYIANDINLSTSAQTGTVGIVSGDSRFLSNVGFWSVSTVPANAGVISTFTRGSDVGFIFGVYFNITEVGATYNFSFKCNISDLTQDFGSGNEPTTVAEFREMYSDDYYDYTLSQWQWSKKGKITSYPTPVIENGTTLLPIEHHIVGLAHYNDGNTDIIYNYAKRELPVGFVQLDYIESTGTQFIDTGYIPNQDTKVDIKVMLRPNLTSGNYCIFSGRTYLDTNSYSLFFLIVNNSVARFDYDDTQLPFSIDFSSLVNTDLEIFTDKNKCYFNGVLKTQANYSEFTSTYPMLIGASYADGVNNNFACMRVYSCKLYDNETLVRNFIPCYRYSDGIEGLYDTVGKQFYTNQGTGRFIRGNIIDGGILNNGN